MTFWAAFTAGPSTPTPLCQLLGFNLVRIPFRFHHLDERVVTSLARKCKVVSRAALKKTVSNPTGPYRAIDYGALALPDPVAPPARPGKGDPACNWYLPETTVADR